MIASYLMKFQKSGAKFQLSGSKSSFLDENPAFWTKFQLFGFSSKKLDFHPKSWIFIQKVGFSSSPPGISSNPPGISSSPPGRIPTPPGRIPDPLDFFQGSDLFCGPAPVHHFEHRCTIWWSVHHFEVGAPFRAIVLHLSPWVPSKLDWWCIDE